MTAENLSIICKVSRVGTSGTFTSSFHSMYLTRLIKANSNRRQEARWDQALMVAKMEAMPLVGHKHQSSSSILILNLTLKCISWKNFVSKSRTKFKRKMMQIIKCSKEWQTFKLSATLTILEILYLPKEDLVGRLRGLQLRIAWTLERKDQMQTKGPVEAPSCLKHLSKHKWTTNKMCLPLELLLQVTINISTNLSLNTLLFSNWINLRQKNKNMTMEIRSLALKTVKATSSSTGLRWTLGFS